MKSAPKHSKTAFYTWLECTVNNAERITYWSKIHLEKAIETNNHKEIDRLTKEIENYSSTLDIFNMYYHSLSFKAKKLVDDIRNYRRKSVYSCDKEYLETGYVLKECYQKYLDIMIQKDAKDIIYIDKRSLGVKLKEIRSGLGYTRDYVARLLQVSVSAISNYENGCRLPSLNHFFALSKIYEFSMENILKLESTL